MKKTLILSWLLLVTAHFAFAIKDTLIVHTTDGKWMKVVLQKEYGNVPSNFQYEDLDCVDENGFVDKVVGVETESYVVDTKFPFLFSQKHRMVQRYRLTENNFIETDGTVRKDISMTAHSKNPEYLLFVLCVVLFCAIALVVLLSFDVKKFFTYIGVLLFCFVTGLFFKEREILVAMIISLCVGYGMATLYEGFKYGGLLFVTIIVSTCCVSVISIIFTQDGFISEIVFATTVIVFAVSVLLIRFLFDYVVRWRWGIGKNKRIKNVG